MKFKVLISVCFFIELGFHLFINQYIPSETLPNILAPYEFSFSPDIDGMVEANFIILLRLICFYGHFTCRHMMKSYENIQRINKRQLWSVIKSLIPVRLTHLKKHQEYKCV